MFPTFSSTCSTWWSRSERRLFAVGRTVLATDDWDFCRAFWVSYDMLLLRTLWSAWNSCYGLSYGAFPSCLQRILCHLCISRWWKEAVHSVVLFSWIILVSVLRLFHFVVSHCLCRLLSVHSDDILSSRITAVGWRVGFFYMFYGISL